MSQQQVRGLAREWPPGASAISPSAWWRYVPVVDCPANSPSQPDAVMCEQAYEQCAWLDGRYEGVMVKIHRRREEDSGEVGEWGLVGRTCFGADVPPRSGSEAGLTEEMIRRAFREIPFAQPVVESAPPGGSRTLVRFDNFFGVGWGGAGHEPREDAMVDLLGHRVVIRPLLESVTYNFGDGTSVGPTTDLGGVTEGDAVVHAYAKSGRYTPQVTVVYTGEYSIDGGAFQPIGETVSFTGNGTPLQVVTSRNVLIP